MIVSIFWLFYTTLLYYVGCLDKWFLLKSQSGLADYSLGLSCFVYEIKKLQVCGFSYSLCIRGKLQQFLGDKIIFLKP